MYAARRLLYPLELLAVLLVPIEGDFYSVLHVETTTTPSC